MGLYFADAQIPPWLFEDMEALSHFPSYSVWLWPDHRCRALALQPVGYPTSPEIQTLALCSSTKVILILIGPCPAFEPPVQTIRASTPRQAGFSWHTGMRTPHSTQICPAL